MKTFRQILFLLVLMWAGGQSANALNWEAVTTMDNVQYYSCFPNAYVIGIVGTEETVIIHKEVAVEISFGESGFTVCNSVKAIGGYYDYNSNTLLYSAPNIEQIPIKNDYVKTLVFESPIDFDYFWFKANLTGCPNLHDIYFLDRVPSFPENLEACFGADYGTRLTLHVAGVSEKRIEELKAMGFKDVVSCDATYPFMLNSSGLGEVSFYGLGYNKLSESTTVSDFGKYTKKGTVDTEGGSVSGEMIVHQNYCLCLTYDRQKTLATLKRNGVGVELQQSSDGTFSFYNETEVEEKVKYDVTFEDMPCKITFQGTANGGYAKYLRNGGNYTWKIQDKGQIMASHGSALTLLMPYDDTRHLTSVRLDGRAVTIPTPLHGYYELVLNVPNADEATVQLVWDTTLDTSTNPTLQVMRSGEGEVELTGFWEWDDDRDGYRNEKTVSCLMTNTLVTVPEPTHTNGWGFRLRMTPPRGKVLRSLLIGFILNPEEEGGKYTLNMNDFVNSTEYEKSTNTYTFLVDLYNGVGEMYFSPGDYIVMVDMGSEETEVEVGNRQTFVRRGGTGRVYLNYEMNAGDYDPNISVGTTNVTLPDYSNEEDCTYADLFIDKVEGEKFTAYRNGVDVTDEFEKRQTEYSYDSDESEQGRTPSVWTLIFEEDEAVKLSYNWMVLRTASVNAVVSTEYSGGTLTTPLMQPKNEVSINTKELQEVRLIVYPEIPMEYDMYLTEYNTDTKLALIKVVREVTGLGLKEAKDLVEAVCDGAQLLKEKVTLAEANQYKATLEEAGGTVELRGDDDSGSTVKVLRDGVDVTTDAMVEAGNLVYRVAADELENTLWVIVTEKEVIGYDVNGDGAVNISDVTALVNKILGK